MKKYPFIEFMAVSGRTVAWWVGGLFVALAIAASLLGLTPVTAVVLAALAPIAYVVVRLGAELIEIISDTLMPR